MFDVKKPCTYDPRQLQDFFDHLMWEVRTVLFEHLPTTPKPTSAQLREADPNNPPGINPELVEQLAKYAEKYNCAGLLVVNLLDLDGDPEEAQKATERHRTERQQHFSIMLEAMELLEPLMMEAIYVLQQQQQGPRLVARKLTPSDILNELPP